ncbi:MAG: hypothetical protein R3Y56_01125 [Akkermansia sp.]
MNALKKLWKQRWILRSIFSSIFFNFYYLPFRQAVHLPILLYKPKFISLGGQIVIKSDCIKFGMIQLGRCFVPVYPNTGIIWENKKGRVSFLGECKIGGNSSLSVNKGANIIFHDDFVATSSVQIISFKAITFGCKCRLGWNSLVMDTGFHPLYDIEKKKFKPAFGAITIGDYNWFGNQCVVMHSVTTPERCIFGLRSVITRGGKYESYAVHGGSPAKLLTRGVMRDYDNDYVEDYGNEEVY